MIVMVQTDPDAPPHKRQSQILVPMDTPGVEILGAMHVFGEDDAPHGHMHLRFTDVRVPESNILLGEGRGFEISQVRLGPGRIHHCMRSVGAAERALELMVKRGLTREAFGKRISNLGKNVEMVAKARIEIESMRRMVLTAAKAMDELGNAEARPVGQRGQGDGADPGLRDHRRGDPGARRHRGLAMDSAGADVHLAAHAPARRRARRGALARRRAGRVGRARTGSRGLRPEGRVLRRSRRRLQRRPAVPRSQDPDVTSPTGATMPGRLPDATRSPR